MGLIIQAAKLVLCESCHSHGVIVYGDGSKSEEFCTLADALAEVDDALLAKKIVVAEAEFLRADIRDSNLPTEADMETLHKVADALQQLAGEDAEQATQVQSPSAGRTLH